MERRQHIEEYYEQSDPDYRRFWATGKTLSLHYGYHDRPNMPHVEAVINMIRVLAEKVGIGPGDRVLDAGCGVGGSSNWIAKHTGAKVTGINITGQQLATAREHAYPGVEFLNMDYMNIIANDGTFTVYWALESSCYAPDKYLFLLEAYRVLAYGGRIAVADGFGTYGRADVLKGWAVPHLAGIEQFHSYMEACGFSNIQFEDITENVMPSSKRMYMAALSMYPAHIASKAFGLRTVAQQENVEAAIEQHKLLTSGEFRYCIFTGVK